MSLFNDIKARSKEMSGSVNDTLSEMRKPKIRQTTVFSMRPTGLYGSIYEDPRGLTSFRIALVLMTLLGVVILAIGLFWITAKIGEANQTTQTSVNLSETVERNIPTLTSLVDLSDAEVFEIMSQSNTMYQTAKTEYGMELVRLPPDISVEELAIYYAEGFSKIDLDSICRVLQNCWFYTSNYTGTTTLKVKYADFTSGSIPQSVSTAVSAQGLDAAGSQILSSGMDEAGNTYQYGTVPYGEDKVLYWKVAACPLTDVYHNDGLPKSSVYVGVTVATSALMTIASEIEGSAT